MSSARESGVKGRIVRAVRASGRWCERMGAGPFLAAGTPDIFVLLRRPLGRLLALEAKRPGQRATRLQQAKMAEIRAGGGAAEVVFSVEDAMAAIEREENGAFMSALVLSVAIRDEFTCDYCAAFHGGALSAPPPHAKCTSKLGCRCVMGATL